MSGRPGRSADSASLIAARRQAEESARNEQEKNRLWWERLPMTYADWSAEDRLPKSAADYRSIRATLLGHSPFLREKFNFADLRGKSVLDLGCGSGVLSCLIAEQGAKVTAVDLTQAGVEVTRQAAEAWGYPVNIARMDAEKLALDSGSFDYVFSWGVLHHTSDTDRAFSEVARVLRTGGHGLIMVYHRHSLVYCCKGLYWLLVKGKIFRGHTLKSVQSFYTDGFYHRHYSRRELRRALQAAGVEVSHVIVTQMQKKILPLLPRFLDEFLKARFGWLIIAKISKPGR
jgi:2-polyprenyl-3-methyl-5-hydroxy-6-metoxy-1,4-benzoquinol methylase